MNTLYPQILLAQLLRGKLKNLSQKWDKGPTSKAKVKSVSVDDYIQWIKKVEAKYDSGSGFDYTKTEAVIERMRRLYYSKHTGSGLNGSKFDEVIALEYMKEDDVPLQTSAFKLTEQSFKALKDENISQAILESLKPLENKEFLDKEKFVEVVKEQQTIRYEALILKHTQTPDSANFKLTEESFKSLKNENIPQAILENLKPLKDKNFSDKEKFLEDIREQIGKEQPISNEALILKHAQTLDIETLNNLFSAKTIKVDDNEIEISHILVALNIICAGEGKVATGGSWTNYDVEWPAVLTWGGDLGHWFTNYADKMNKAKDADSNFKEDENRQTFLAETRAVAPPDDLLGDLDGQIIAGLFTKQNWNLTTYPTHKLSVMLQAYYTGTIYENRFHLFVKHANPPIPHTVISNNKVNLKETEAKTKIREEVKETANMFLSQKQGDKWKNLIGFNAKGIDDYEEALDSIIDQFIKYLQHGLETGKAVWPIAGTL